MKTWIRTTDNFCFRFSSNGSRMVNPFRTVPGSPLNMISQAKCSNYRSSPLVRMTKAPTQFALRTLWAKMKHRVNSPFDRPRRSILDRSSRPRSLPHWRSKHHHQLRRTCRRWNHRRWSFHWKMPIWKKEYLPYSPRRSSDDQRPM